MPMRLAFNGCATSHRRMRQELLLWDGFFSRTKHQLEQQFGLPSVGKGTLHDVSASATKPASVYDGCHKLTKRVYLASPRALLLVALFVCIYFFDRRCETAALR